MTGAAGAPRGASTGGPDLWCTYAAVRTLAWLGRAGETADPEGTVRYLASRRNADGGYAWDAGMPSDSWATFYCTQALADLGRPPARPEPTARWLDSTWTGEAYGMQPGQGAEAWATHFGTRTAALLRPGQGPPDRARLLDWLRALQGPDGGLGWTPADARRDRADVRACYYGVLAWAAAAGDAPPPWDVPRLTAWLRARQDSSGGFRFSPEAGVPCMWATYRATGALAALGAGPADPGGCADWVLRLRGAGGAFVRWEGYAVEDVWASFCAVGTLRALGVPTEPVAAPVARRIAELACPGGGYTYREPERADDALASAALALRPDTAPGRRAELVRWLEACRLPNEDGVMYMPGRGAEVRCTLWAVAAGAFAADPEGRAAVVRWLAGLQNEDGGFGYWAGRGSDLVSTSSAVETLRLLGADPAAVLDPASLLGFTESCAASGEGDGDGCGDAYGPVPGAPAGLRATLQAHRVLAAAGRPVPAVAPVLERHRVRGGGFADRGNRLPDLLSTYEAVVAAERAGLPLDTAHLEVFLKAVDRPDGTAWTPLSPSGGGPLAAVLGVLLRGRAGSPAAPAGEPLPALTLS
ncbi:prenyltransferase/squalene oxidase repeat-containing protein [Streptomyces sp. NPDC012888]|uniref:prenyltransferase/squalene oxidase repeat-containing protein n=1 Tax=Streptomyces sp. NPDC012888 TaxID=3364855 RepID=UPI0036CE5F4B